VGEGHLIRLGTGIRLGIGGVIHRIPISQPQPIQRFGRRRTDRR
jgi:hypothetical protein